MYSQGVLLVGYGYFIILVTLQVCLPCWSTWQTYGWNIQGEKNLIFLKIMEGNKHTMILDKIIAKSFLKPMKSIELHIQESLWTLGRMNAKSSTSSIQQSYCQPSKMRKHLQLFIISKKLKVKLTSDWLFNKNNRIKWQSSCLKNSERHCLPTQAIAFNGKNK